MTRDDVIRLAREAGFFTHRDDSAYTKELERFAELVIKEHTHQVVTDPAEIRRVFEIDEADYPPPDSGFAKL